MAKFTFSRSLNQVQGKDGDMIRALGDTNRPASQSSVLNSISTFKTPSKSAIYGSGAIHNPKSGSKITQQTGDRYMINRSTTDIGKLQFEFSMNDTQNNTSAMVDGSSEDDRRILRFKSAAVGRPISPRKKCNAIPQEQIIVSRVLPNAPEKVLDAPNLDPSFYFNLIDWSAEDVIAVGLNNEVYIWNASNGQTSRLMYTECEDEKICSVRWSPVATEVLAVSTNLGRVYLYNSSTLGRIRTMNASGENSHQRIPVTAWLDHLISAGSFTGAIMHNDIRIAQHEVNTFKAHSQEVLGLSWSPDKLLLASGGNDNQVCIWSTELSQGTKAEPMHRLLTHCSAVKAISWCPWKPNLLVTGGGSADHHMRFWNANTAALVKDVDVQGQVSGILWNMENREILTCHGSSDKLLRLWKYPSVSLIADLFTTKSNLRIPAMCVSPNGQHVAFLDSDQSTQIWHVFPPDPTKKKAVPLNLNNAFPGTNIR